MDWTKGKLVQNVTSVTLVNATAKDVDFTVPSHKRWLLFAVKMTNPDSVLRTIHMIIYKEAAKTNLFRYLASRANVATGDGLQYPSGVTGGHVETRFYAPIILENANTVNLRWDSGGISAGGTDADGAIIEYLEIDV